MLSIARISKTMRQKNQSRLVNRYRQLSPRRPKRLVAHGATSKSKKSAASDTRSSSSSFFRGQIESAEQFHFDLVAGICCQVALQIVGEGWRGSMISDVLTAAVRSKDSLANRSGLLEAEISL